MTEVKKQTYHQRFAEVTRQSIIQAARKFFVAQGYRTATMSAIASEAGVAERTVYNTFATKQELLAAVCTAWLEEAEVKPLIVDALAQADDHSKLEHRPRGFGRVASPLVLRVENEPHFPFLMLLTTPDQNDLADDFRFILDSSVFWVQAPAF